MSGAAPCVQDSTFLISHGFVRNLGLGEWCCVVEVGALNLTSGWHQMRFGIVKSLAYRKYKCPKDSLVKKVKR